jgi:hypothetical protein
MPSRRSFNLWLAVLRLSVRGDFVQKPRPLRPVDPSFRSNSQWPGAPTPTRAASAAALHRLAAWRAQGTGRAEPRATPEQAKAIVTSASACTPATVRFHLKSATTCACTANGAERERPSDAGRNHEWPQWYGVADAADAAIALPCADVPRHRRFARHALDVRTRGDNNAQRRFDPMQRDPALL